MLKKSEDNRATNNIYLTTKCNFSCEYCYEKEARDDDPSYIRDFTSEDLVNSFKNIVEREGMEKSSMIVLFGGEPFLQYDLFWEAVHIARLYSPKKFNLLAITNGLFLSNEMNFKHYCWNFLGFVEKIDNVNFSTDISYDASGHYRRVLPDGSPTKEIVEKAIGNFEKYALPYKLRYTIHKGNALNFKRDIVEIMERFPTMSRLEIAPYSAEIDEFHPDGFEAFQKDLTPYIREVYKYYGRPICTLVESCCDICEKCTPFIYDCYYVSDKEEILTPKDSNECFDHFD